MASISTLLHSKGYMEKNSRHIDKTQSKLIRLEVKVTLNLHFKCIELLETKIRKAEKLKATEASLWTEVTKPEKE